jgi:hypothetical protein
MKASFHVTMVSMPKRAGTPPLPSATNNLKKTVALQVNIDPEVKREFRVYAAEHDVDMSVLFTAMWRYYKDNHG